MDIIDIEGEEFLEDSATAGIRLCKYAREELRIPEEGLPIVCLSGRSDEDEIKSELRKVGVVDIFSRAPQNPNEDILFYIKRKIPKLN